MPERILMIEDDEAWPPCWPSTWPASVSASRRARSAASGLALLRKGGFDALILDVMLPDADGFEVCRRVRAESDLPILMLTARGDETDRIVGLELGADDYLPKPFNPRELAARLRAILRRRAGAARASEMLRFGRLEIDRGARVVRVDGAERPLTSYQFDLLWTLAQQRRPRDVARRADGQAARRGSSRLSTAASTCTYRASAPPSRTIPGIRAASSPCAARGMCSPSSRTGSEADEA